MLLAWSILPISRLASRRLGFGPGLAVTVAYAASFGMVQAVLVDFHEVALAAPLMAYAAEGLADRRWRQVVIASLPLVLVKEDLGVTVAAIGLVCAVRGRGRLGALLAAFGLAASAVEILWLIPALSSTANYPYFAQFGTAEGGSRSLFGALSPDNVRRGLGEKVGTLLTYTYATAGLCWFSSLTLVALPTLVWRFLAANPLYWETDWHYDLILMPVVFAAAIEVLARLSTSESRVARWYSQAVPLTLAGFAVVLVALSPAADVVRPSAWATTPRQQALEDGPARDPARCGGAVGPRAALTPRRTKPRVLDRRHRRPGAELHRHRRHRGLDPTATGPSGGLLQRGIPGPHVAGRLCRRRHRRASPRHLTSDRREPGGVDEHGRILVVVDESVGTPGQGRGRWRQ